MVGSGGGGGGPLWVQYGSNKWHPLELCSYVGVGKRKDDHKDMRLT